MSSSLALSVGVVMHSEVFRKSSGEIALILNITEKTVRNHISNVIGKLGVSSRTQAILELLRHNVIKIDK